MAFYTEDPRARKLKNLHAEKMRLMNEVYSLKNPRGRIGYQKQIIIKSKLEHTRRWLADVAREYELLWSELSGEWFD